METTVCISFPISNNIEGVFWESAKRGEHFFRMTNLSEALYFLRFNPSGSYILVEQSNNGIHIADRLQTPLVFHPFPLTWRFEAIDRFQKSDILARTPELNTIRTWKDYTRHLGILVL